MGAERGMHFQEGLLLNYLFLDAKYLILVVGSFGSLSACCLACKILCCTSNLAPCGHEVANYEGKQLCCRPTAQWSPDWTSESVPEVPFGIVVGRCFLSNGRHCWFTVIFKVPPAFGFLTERIFEDQVLRLTKGLSTDATQQSSSSSLLDTSD